MESERYTGTPGRRVIPILSGPVMFGQQFVFVAPKVVELTHAPKGSEQELSLTIGWLWKQ